MHKYRSAVLLWLIVFVFSLPLAPPTRASLDPPRPELKQGAADQVLIVLPSAWRTDAAINLAVSDLVSLLGSRYHLPVRVDADSAVAALPALTIVVGDATNTWLKTLQEAGAYDSADLPAESYRIVRTTFSAYPVLVIQGADLLGSAYGTFHLVELLRLNRLALFQPLDILRSPPITLRATSNPTGASFPSPEEALRAGYNTVFIEQWPTLVSYATYDPAIVDAEKYASYTTWVQENRQRVRAEIARARLFHLRIATMGDVISFPKQALSLYRTQATYDDDLTRFCIAKPKTREMLAYALDDLLTAFPEIDYVMVRTGENYSSGPLTGNNPVLGRKEACGNLGEVERLQLVINTVYGQVVEKHGKTYIHRAWDLGNDGFHANPEVARAVLSGVPKRDKLIVSFKHTRTDYWRFNAVNPNIGALDVNQMVEVQVAREYEGKGAFPNYIGELVALGGAEVAPQGGLDYAHQRGVRAIWVWAKGGGWGGPEVRSNLWLDANMYAVSHLIWDTEASPQVLALQWATLRFGPRAAQKVASVLMKSDDAVLYAFYVGPLGKRRPGWTPNHLWVRDDIIQGAETVAEIYKATKDGKDFDAVLREKRLALEILDGMIAEYTGVIALAEDPDVAERALNTLMYERSLVETLTHYLVGMLHFYRWQDSDRRDFAERKAALEELESWQESWRRHTTVIASLRGVATPYRDSGMVKTATTALQQLKDVR